MRTATLIFALSAGIFASVASAEVYMGVGGGVVVYDVPGVNRAGDVRVTLGYRNQTPFFVEATGHGTGKSRIDGTTNRLQTLGGGLSLGLRAPLDRKGSGLFVKGGYYLANARNYVGPNGSKPYNNDRGDGVSYGLGAEWYFTPHFGLRTDVEVYDNLDAFGTSANATFINLSLMAAFGGGVDAEAPVATTQPVYRSTRQSDVRYSESVPPAYIEPYVDQAPRTRGPYTVTVPYTSAVEAE